MTSVCASPAPRPLPCRRHRRPRCRVCGLHEGLCVCARLPRVRVPFRFLLVQHAVETLRPTNTGRLLCRVVPGSRVLVYGSRDVPLDEAALADPGTDYLLLFPSPDARPLGAADLGPLPGRALALVAPDGSWRQASHMARRIPALRGMRAVRLPDDSPGEWTIRRPDRPGRLCTAEAGFRVLRAAGRAAEAGELQRWLRLIMARMLFMRGRLPHPPGPAEFGLEEP